MNIGWLSVNCVSYGDGLLVEQKVQRNNDV